MGESASTHGPYDPSKKLTHLTHWPIVYTVLVGQYHLAHLQPSPLLMLFRSTWTELDWTGLAIFIVNSRVRIRRVQNWLSTAADLVSLQPITSWRWRARDRWTRRDDFVVGHFRSVHAAVLWRCWLGGSNDIRPVKNWVVGCWRGYLSGARCRLAYGPTDATVTHCLLLQ